VIMESRGTGVKNVEVRQGVYTASKKAGASIVEELVYVGTNV